MTTKEKVVRESIKRIERRIKKIDDILNAEPLQEIINIRKEAQRLIKSDLSPHEQVKKISELQKRETKQRNIFEMQQKKYTKLISEKGELTFELYDLKNELYLIERQK